MILLPIENQGTLKLIPSTYGQSVLGAPLHVWLPENGFAETLIFAGIHGQEPDTIVLLSQALRGFSTPPKNCGVILCANPDGTLRGTRCNANGVDLNRNFPASNWKADVVSDPISRNGKDFMTLSPGAHANSEPETQALVNLIKKLNPRNIIALHGPLGCIDDPNDSALGRWLSKRSGLKLVTDIGYPTPGSFGSWAKENGYPVITYELPDESIWTTLKNHVDIFQEVLLKGEEAWVGVGISGCLSWVKSP